MTWTELDTWITLTGVLVALACALPGTFLVLNRQSMLGDGISHAVLPGLALAFLISGSREVLPMLIGAILAGVLTAVLTQAVHRLGQVESGAALGVVFCGLFAVGLILIRLASDQVDLDADCVLYGSIETAVVDVGRIPRVTLISGGMLLVNALLTAIFYKELRFAAFDPALASTLGFNADALRLGLAINVAITTVIAFESVGSILVIAMLVVPAAAASLLTRRLHRLLALALVFAALAAVLGHFAAILLPPWLGRVLGIKNLGVTSSAAMMAVVIGVEFLIAWALAAWIQSRHRLPTLPLPALLPALALCVVPTFTPPLHAAPPPRESDLRTPSVSGIYPHLALFNEENECGTGAVVPWADRLWVITYGPHLPTGSSDRLYEITPDLQLIPRPESIGGTPANRMIHRESDQLFIGPYAINAQRHVRAIPYSRMFGRLTGNARHLTDPAHKLYVATMEEGLYEIDVRTLDVQRLWTDEQQTGGRHARLPGYHGKGLYSGQGRIVYANNGEHGALARTNPATPSGVLAEWDGRSDAWSVIRRAQFTEVTGPGGLLGNPQPATDPLWSIGWDHRSLLLLVLDAGHWHAYRLPKASHCYDGAHGWNTEWPRIRDVGTPEAPDFLMTMHGMFWRFPSSFSPSRSAGLAPRSTYLKVIGDFCRWKDHLVFGCDDSARSEFLNKRRTKGDLAGPVQSQSNLWFTSPETPDHLGPALGRGAVWLEEPVRADQPSEPFLFSGFARRGLHLHHAAPHPVTFQFEIDPAGNGQWRPLREVTLPPRSSQWLEFAPRVAGAWIRLRPRQDAPQTTAIFHYSNPDPRPSTPAPLARGLAQPGSTQVLGGRLRALGQPNASLAIAVSQAASHASTLEPSASPAFYQLDPDLRLRPAKDPNALSNALAQTSIPDAVLTVDPASVLVIDDAGRRWRLPKGDPAFDQPGLLGPERVDREVCTERDLFNAHGTFYELPAENAGGFARIRPITTHNRRIHDYASYRGLLVLTGIAKDATGDRILRSDDGHAAVWVGVVDDLWAFGKSRGRGGPWNHSPVVARQPSDPYLMNGYDRKTLRLDHDHDQPVSVRIEIDASGTGLWSLWRTLTVPPAAPVELRFPDAFSAYWIRFIADTDCRATAELTYE